MEQIVIIIYFIIGVLLTIYWFTRYYEKKCNKAYENEETREKGVVCIILLTMAVFWPFVLVKNVIFHKSI